MIRLGLIGCGRWGRNYVGAAADSGLARVTKIAHRGDPLPRDVDALVVAVHPRDAVDIACRGLALGLPVMVEKPAGLSFAEAERLAHAEWIAEGVVLVAHQHLFAERMEELHELAADLPSIRGSAYFGGPGPERDYSPLWDYGPHAASAALALLGGEATVGAVENLSWMGGACFAVNSARGHVVCSINGKRTEKIASVSASWMFNNYDGYASGDEPPLTRAVRAFARAVSDGGTEDWRFGASWAVRVAKILEEVQSRG